MTVWVLVDAQCWGELYQIYGVFTSRSLAQEAAKPHKGPWEIWECELDKFDLGKQSFDDEE